MKWPIIVVAILALIYLLYMVKVFVEIIHKKGKYYPGISIHHYQLRSRMILAI